MDKITIRSIQQNDNAFLANIIRSALKEFKANKPGTVYFDESTDHLYELFQTEKGTYHGAVLNEQIAGGAGIFHTNGLDPDTCELVKMYLAPIARGKGIDVLITRRASSVRTSMKGCKTAQKRFAGVGIEMTSSGS